jgi:hypothetical protein
MQILVSIDDTDNLDSRGTGALASLIAKGLEANDWGSCRYITRHQLLVHPDVPYTSHNASMCFAADIRESCLDTVIDYACRFLAEESAEGSDPGLCVAVVERIGDPAPLIAFGKKAKAIVLAKDDAYASAREMGFHLSEHGGTGQGVIGALAGAGLRLSGNDGRLRGHIAVKSADGLATVSDLCGTADIDAVRSVDGADLGPGETVKVGDRVKTVFLDGKSVLLVVPLDADGAGVPWQACPKEFLKLHY